MNRKNMFFQTVLCVAGFVLFSGCAKEETKPDAAVSTTPVVAPATTANEVALPEAKTNDVAPREIETAATSGVSGKITLKGTPPPERDLPLTPECGQLHTSIPKTRFYVVDKNGALADVFVHIKEGLNGKTFPAPTEPVLLDQIGCEYTPYIIGLQTGQKLMVRNSDPFMHNVHSLPKVSGNKESNKAQMTKAPDLEYTFNTPENFLTFKCDVHPWMFAYVGVVDNPFFAVSENDGTFLLKNVPDGKYVVEAMHRKAGRQTKEISVTGGKSEPINFTFEIPAAQ